MACIVINAHVNLFKWEFLKIYINIYIYISVKKKSKMKYIKIFKYVYLSHLFFQKIKERI